MKMKKTMLTFFTGTLLLLSLSFAGNAGAVRADFDGGYAPQPKCDSKGNCTACP